MTNEGSKGIALLLLLALAIGGAFLAFDLMDYVWESGATSLGLGFEDIKGFSSGLWIIIARLVGLVLVIGCPWIMYKIIRD